MSDRAITVSLCITFAGLLAAMLAVADGRLPNLFRHFMPRHRRREDA